MEWLKLHSEIAFDPKVTSMTEAYRWRLVSLMCAHKLGMMPGLSDPELAGWMRISVADLKRTKDMFLTKRFIDETWKLINWEKRQQETSAAAERMRRHRDKSRDVTVAQPLRNSDVTVAQLAGARQIRLDEIRLEPPLIPPRGKKVFVLPEWIPQQDWDDYLAMRLKIRKPATERAKQLAVLKLDELRSQGHSPAAVLQQSILRDYQGLFPITVDRNGKPDSPKPFNLDLTQQENDEMERIAEVKRKQWGTRPEKKS